MELEVREGLLYVGQTKRNRHSAAKPKGKRLALPLDLNELPKEGARVLKQYESGLIKLPTSIRNAKDYKNCGDAFRQYLDRHPYWISLKQKLGAWCLTGCGMATHGEERSTTTEAFRFGT